MAALGREASPGDDVLVDDAVDFSTPIACTNGPPTLSTTSSIAIDESGSGQATLARLVFANGRLEPGTGDVETGTAEIELTFNTDSTGTDELFIDGGTESADQSFRFGALSVTEIDGNLNGDNDADDVKVTGVERLQLNPGSGDDTFTGDGSGSVSFTGAVPTGMIAFQSQGDDTYASGGGSNNSYTGGLGNDTVTGGPGADSFQMGPGNDTYDGGGGGADTVNYSMHPNPLTLDLGSTSPQDTGGAGIDTVINAENIVGGNASDNLTGDDAPNVIFGGNAPGDAGDDVLDGKGGSDQLLGRPGNDVLIGGAGNDTLVGEVGTDTASFALGSTGPVTFSLDPTLTGVPQNTGGAGMDTLADSSILPDPDTNHEVENLTGSPFAGDVLTGNSLANFIDVRDGLADTVTCLDPPPPPPADSVRADHPGLDSINADCETVDFAAAPPVVGPPVVDMTAPDTAISGKRKVRTRKKKARVTFTLGATEPGSRFECSIDSKSFIPCFSPFSTKLRLGRHLLMVRATDALGNQDATPASVPVTIGRMK